MAAVASSCRRHQEISVAGKGHHGALRRHQLGSDTCRQAEAHAAEVGANLRAQAAVAPEAVRPGEKLPAPLVTIVSGGNEACSICTTCTDRVAASHPHKPAPAPATLRSRCAHRACLQPRSATRTASWRQGARRSAACRRDHHLAWYTRPKFLDALVHVNQRLPWPGTTAVNSRRGHLAQARPDGKQQVGVAHAPRQLRVDADATSPT